MRRLRVFLPPATAALVACLLAGIAMAGAPGINLKGAKRADGPYRELVRVNVTDPRNLYVKAVNRSDDAIEATLSEQTFGPGSGGDYEFTWFRGDTDISHDVQTSGYDFSIPSDKARKFRVRVKPDVPDPARVCLNPTMTGPAFGGNDAFFAINGRRACGNLG